MRDTKSLLLLLVSLLLVLVSFVLIWTWGYSFYTSNEKSVLKSNTVAIDSAKIAGLVRDSLEKVYTATLNELDIQLDSTLTNSDSLKNQLDVKLAEFYRLRTEIVDLLQNRNTNNNLAVAKQKINELQTKVDDLKDKNQVVDSENKKLNELLDQIRNSEKNTGQNTNSTNIVKSKSAEKSTTVYSLFTATNLKLSAIFDTDKKEAETSQAEKADKFNGSFTVMNFNSQLTNAEMLVVVLRPDGRVLKNSSWDSGTFNTSEGKKVYSYKFSFNYTRGEAKLLLFSLKGGGTLIKGNYTMEVYHNGQIIGRTIKMLS